MVGPQWEGGQIFTSDDIEKIFWKKRSAKKAETCVKTPAVALKV